MGAIMVACIKDSDQLSNPDIRKIPGTLICEVFNFFDYDFGYKYDPSNMGCL